MPHLNLYGSDGLYISSNSASAVSEDGTDATFPSPTQAGGGSLAAGLYTFNMWNPGPYTQPRFVGGGFFSVGSNDTSRQAPYGVDAVTFNYAQQDCSFDGLNVYCGQYYTWSTLGGVLTLSATGQVNGTYGTITVGNQPTAIKAYGDYHYYEDRGYGGFYQSDEPSNAIVTNFGSNTVSIVDLINNSVVNTIAVGTGPIAVVLNSNQSKAYVANYGSASLSEINLSTNTQTRVAAIGAQPEALAMDPGGTALWVAGQGYISKLDLNSLSAIQSFSVSGQVTSVAVSAGQSTLVYTTVATSGGSTTFQAQQASISSGIVQGTYAQYSMSSSSYYAQAITVGGPAPGTPGWLMPGGALVSSTYGNGAAVIGTPTGFVVLDLVAKNEILEGSTPSAVRGIATDPFQGIIYLTAPDSNSLITVPLPPPQ